MAQTADLSVAGRGDRALRSARNQAHRLFATALISAILLRIALNFGFGGLLGMITPVLDDLVNWVPWLLLLVAVGGAWMMYGQIGALRFAGNRLMRHILWWTLAGLVVLAVTLAGDLARPLFDLLGKPGGIIVKFCADHGFFIAVTFGLIGLGLTLAGTEDIALSGPAAVEKLWVQNITAKIAGVPMVLTASGIFVGATLWTVYYSLTRSRMLPSNKWVGLDQYERLWSSNNSRWWASIEHLAIYAIVVMTFSLVVGFLLAALLDQKIRFENTFRTILLYPFALSFIVTGLVWQWLLNPSFGVENIVRSLGWESFRFDPLFNPDIVMYGICIAALWQGTGLIMCLMLAGLRGIDEDIWKAARVDGIPMWKTYIFIVIPMMRPVFITTIVLIASGILRVYDLVVAQTSGGPGIASEVPAKYVYEYMFTAQNLGQGFAASTMMLVAVLPIIAIWAFIEFGGRKDG